VKIHVLVIGAGMLGSAVITEVLARPPWVARVASLGIIDPGQVRELTLITSPPYRNFLRWSKARAAGKLASQQLCEAVLIQAHPLHVQEVDLGRMLGALQSQTEDLVLLVLTPDSWPARLNALWQSRLAARCVSGRVVALQMGVDRNLVQASVFGNRFDDPCPVCGLASPSLPGPEPCLVQRPGGELLRGDLHRERQAAVTLAGTLLEELAAGRPDSVNRKILLQLEKDTNALERFEHRLEPRPDCWGPHDLRRAPVPLADLLGA
jgi:hypothetical protein